MPMDRTKYPSNWDDISHQIRFVRALGQCEWIEPDTGIRCPAFHDCPHPLTGSRVILTTAHLADEDPMNVDPANLAAYCQLHHLRYDAARRKNRITEKNLLEAGFKRKFINSSAPIWRFSLGHLRLGGGRGLYGEDPSDLCIDVAPTHSDPKVWYCWLHRDDPPTFIFIRNMRCMTEIFDLFFGLTGRKFSEVKGG